ncbi:hypothetical protein CDIK_2126 [Cucumispora dikerogammari]|nr:hypothetical protein CDIK_2126 [Cucumispora dikerogammari]
MTVSFFHFFSTVFSEPLKTKKISLTTRPGKDMVLNDRLEVNNQTFMFFRKHKNYNIVKKGFDDKLSSKPHNNTGCDHDTDNGDDSIDDNNNNDRKRPGLNENETVNDKTVKDNKNTDIGDNKNLNDKDHKSSYIDDNRSSNISDNKSSNNRNNKSSNNRNNKSSNNRNNKITETVNKKLLVLRPLQSVYPIFYTLRKEARYRTSDTSIIFLPFDRIEIQTLSLTGKYIQTDFYKGHIRQLYESEDVRCPGTKNEHKIKFIVDIVPPLLLLKKSKCDEKVLELLEPMKSELSSIEEENGVYRIVITSNLYCRLIEEEEIIVGFIDSTQ